MAVSSSPASSNKPTPPGSDSSGYQLVHQDEDRNQDNDPELEKAPLPIYRSTVQDRRFRNATYILTVLVIILLATNLYLTLPYSFHGIISLDSDSCPCKPTRVPQYFQTSPELWAGPTATGKPAFMAQTRVIDPTGTFVPNEPLQTSIPIEGMKEGNDSIFKLMGYLSPYSPSPGFGVPEYPLPEGAEIVQVQMLSRHGARYPTVDADVAPFAERLANASGFEPKKSLSFLKNWKYQLGKEILVPRGRQELYDSGVLHSYMYGKLYNPQSRLIVRTTTQDRMLKSAENWLAGFFGLQWTKNATIEVIIEDFNFNNSLAGSLNCPNAYPRATGDDARWAWVHKYLPNAVSRFQSMTKGFEWTIEDVYAAQSMCPYETVAYGFSKFCDLFTYEEWQHYGYSIDLYFAGVSGFHSPTGRAIGIGYQQEVIARLKNHTLGYSGSQINVTLDSSLETFPLNQSLYFDFSHDTNIVSILTAFGLRQFAEELPSDKNPGDHAFTISHVTPFGARLDIEIIKAPKPVSPDRDGYLDGGETKYIHFVLNQRTLPLGLSFPECGADRKDGWCELDTFLRLQEGMADLARYDYACFADYPYVPYEDITDGAPKK